MCSVSFVKHMWQLVKLSEMTQRHIMTDDDDDDDDDDEPCLLLFYRS